MRSLRFKSLFITICTIGVALALASLAIYGLVIVILYKVATNIDFSHLQ